MIGKKLRPIELAPHDVAKIAASLILMEERISATIDTLEAATGIPFRSHVRAAETGTPHD